MEAMYVQVGVVGSLMERRDPATDQLLPPDTDLQTLKRVLPDALVEASSLYEVRGLPSAEVGASWVARLRVEGARTDKSNARRTNVLVRVQAPAMEAALDESAQEPATSVLSALQTAALVDQRLIAKAQQQGTTVLNTSVGLPLYLTLGAPAAELCRCFEGAWTVDLGGETCPRVRVDTTIITIAMVVLAAIVPTASMGLFQSGLASWSGTLTVVSVGLQVLDVVSDASFTYQLVRERGCEMPWLVTIALASIGVSMLVNIALAMVLLRCWPVDGLRQHAG